MAEGFADLADLPEDDRIEIIGRTAEAGKKVAFVVDDDEKADRYVRKLIERHAVRVLSRGPGPVKSTVVTVGPIGPRTTM